MNSQDKKHYCNQCDRKFKTSASLADHTRDAHKSEYDAEDTYQWALSQTTVGEEQDFGA